MIKGDPGLFGYSVTPSHILKGILIQNTSEIAYFIEDRSSYLEQFELYINDLNNQTYPENTKMSFKTHLNVRFNAFKITFK